MKKQEFLDELKSYLKVLQDAEQEDIIEEYSQHIEMKKERGLSEEEAIRDFGPVHQLAGEILEAYHVKPEYEKEMGKKRDGKEGKESLEKTEALKKYGKCAKERLRRMCEGLWQMLRHCAGKVIYFLKFPFRAGKTAGKQWREKLEMNAMSTELQTERTQKGQKAAGTMIKAAGKGTARGIRLLLRYTISGISWCCRLGWNLCVLFAAVGSVCFGLMFLFLFGGLSVLWMRGYPLAGVVLGCLGAVLCFASLSTLSLTFFRVKHEKGEKKYE